MPLAVERRHGTSAGRFRFAGDHAVSSLVTRRPDAAGYDRWTADLDHRMAEHGMAAVSRELERLVAVARRVGIAPMLLDVLADPTQPEPARCRAFVHVRAALVATQETLTRPR